MTPSSGTSTAASATGKAQHYIEDVMSQRPIDATAERLRLRYAKRAIDMNAFTIPNCSNNFTTIFYNFFSHKLDKLYATD